MTSFGRIARGVGLGPVGVGMVSDSFPRGGICIGGDLGFVFLDEDLCDLCGLSGRWVPVLLEVVEHLEVLVRLEELFDLLELFDLSE